ncbi:MAG: site-specific integrase [Fibrobacteria bacterium]|nr:site-specific integrase [Fibrobacteria bacterium]
MSRVQTKYGSLYQRGKGKVWYIYFKSAKGVFKQESTSQTDLAKAKKVLEKRFREEAAQPVFNIKEKRHTFEDLAVKYCQDKNTSKNDMPYIEKLVAHFGTCNPVEIRVPQIRAFKAKLNNIKSPRTKRHLSQCTKNNTLRWLKAVLRYGAELDWYPLGKVAMIKIPVKDEVVRFRFPTWEELQNIINMSSPHLKLAIRIAVFTGMRRGEILNLKWDQIDLDEGYIYLSPQETKEQYPRWVPILPQLEPFLIAEMSKSEYVINYHGKPVKEIRKAWTNAKTDAEIEDLRFHDLRHWARRFFRQAGVKPELLKAILGHHCSKTSERYDSVFGEDFVELKQLCNEHAKHIMQKSK